MNGKKHKPPSRIRYEDNNPVFSVRMPKEWHDRLNKLLEDACQSRKDFLGIALGKHQPNYEQLKNHWYEEGYKEGSQSGKNEGLAKGKEAWGLWYHCYICKELMYIKPGDENHDSILEYSKRNRWCHYPECPSD